jgi:hypothetical protein
MRWAVGFALLMVLVFADLPQSGPTGQPSP